VSAPRVLVCDFGGVLTSPLSGSFAAFSRKSGVPLESLGRAMARLAERHGENPVHVLERGELSEPDFLARVGAELSEELGREIDMSSFAETYFHHLELNKDLVARLPGWRGDGVRLALCTNNVREWEARWRAMLPVDELFEVVVDSAFVGVRKPDRRIYEIVLERLGDVAAPECLFVDDLEVNCEGARAVGMEAVRFEHNEQALPAIEAALRDGRVEPQGPSAS
jgi:putative hydrolase of the HAD superfamily